MENLIKKESEDVSVSVVSAGETDLTVERLLNILNLNGILEEQIVSVVVNKEPELPLHFTSICYYVTVSFTQESGKPPLELFVKKLKANAEIKEDDEFSLFEREANVYTRVLPALQKFSRERSGLNRQLYMFPDVLYTGEREIFMENLSKQSHIMLDMEDRHTFHEASLVLKALASFHGVSYAFIQEIGLKTFQQRYPHTRERMMKRWGVGCSINTLMIDSTIAKITSLLKESELQGSGFAYEALSKYKSCAFTTMCDIVEEKQLFNVLNHGDCWNCNIFFSQDKNCNFKQVKFVDLQMTRVGSSNLDIGYYFFNSLKPKVRKTGIIDLLEVYYEEFTKTVQLLHGKVDFSFKEFVHDYGKISKLGFLFGVYIAAANPLLGKVDLENSTNWIKDLVNAIAEWLDNSRLERDQVLLEVIQMTEDFNRFGDL